MHLIRNEKDEWKRVEEEQFFVCDCVISMRHMANDKYVYRVNSLFKLQNKSARREKLDKDNTVAKCMNGREKIPSQTTYICMFYTVYTMHYIYYLALNGCKII